MPKDESIGLDALEIYDPPSFSYAIAAHVAQVAVDPGTGLVTVERYYVVHDCGRVLNPTIVEGQSVGAIVQGIGAVLMEGALQRRWAAALHNYEPGGRGFKSCRARQNSIA